MPVSFCWHFRSGGFSETLPETEKLSALVPNQSTYVSILLTVASLSPEGLLIFAFRPCSHPAALYWGSAEIKKK
jgi:hypothetical protein